MNKEIDVLENEILLKYPHVLDTLLRDRTTKGHIFWATNNYEHLGEPYKYNAPITPNLITGDNGNIIMPRVNKELHQQSSRSKEMAEVFTPSWVCNAQINLIDDAWFGRTGVFNQEIVDDQETNSWKTNEEFIVFPPGKTWQQYVSDTRLEISCGEGPYITSRYDSNTGEFIPVKNRVGILDRKLRVVNENCHNEEDWLNAARKAVQSTYGYEWQGDSLVLTREAILFSFIDNFILKFNKEPSLDSIVEFSYIISWNIWQMDGLKGVVPNSCSVNNYVSTNLFGEKETHHKACNGCLNNDIKKHNGTYCAIREWEGDHLSADHAKNEIRFIDLIE